MKYSNQVGAAASLLVILSCFLTWVIIPGLNIYVTGFSTEGTGFGKPGIMNVFMSAIALVLFLVPKLWAKKTNLFFAGFNLAWAFRNYILVSTCHGGDCPSRQWGLYLLLGASLIQMVMAALPRESDIKTGRSGV